MPRHRHLTALDATGRSKYLVDVISFWYQELVGGAVFLVGLLVAWRGGELGLGGRRGRRVALLLAGFGLLALLQGLLQWAATR